MNIKPIFLILTLFFFVLTGCGDPTPDYATYEAWDVDGDGIVEENEYTNTFRDAGYYSAWDLNDDGIIEEAEWDTGLTTYYPAYNYGTYGYDTWDLNEDNMLDEDEFTVGNYHLWDTDRDGNVEAVEYEQWYHEL